MTLSFFIPGIAKTAGSKRAFVLPNTQFRTQKGNMSARAVVVDAAGKESKEWKAQVKLFAAQQLPEGFTLMTGPLKVAFTFYRPRPGGHFKSDGKSLSKQGSETPHPIARPDVLKLARAVEDSLTGIVWGDDAQIVTETLGKRWGQPGVQIEITAETEEPKEIHAFEPVAVDAKQESGLRHPFGQLPF